jgi:aldose sugar dehydrogenase
VFGDDQGDFTAPLKVYEESVAPSGATFWRGEFWFATLRGAALRRIDLDTGADEAFLEGDYGRLRTVRVGPDNALYILTSNRDGRGSPADSDDRVLRLSAR